MNERADNPLKGKRILVLGDPSGIGHYVAVTIQKNKCRVFMTG